jgi:hypothetical protein
MDAILGSGADEDRPGIGAATRDGKKFQARCVERLPLFSRTDLTSDRPSPDNGFLGCVIRHQVASGKMSLAVGLR